MEAVRLTEGKQNALQPHLPGGVYGQGVPQDYARAHLWYNLAASKLPPGTVRNRAVKSRDKVAAKMFPAQISEAQKLAREWKPK